MSEHAMMTTQQEDHLTSHLSKPLLLLDNAGIYVSSSRRNTTFEILDLVQMALKDLGIV